MMIATCRNAACANGGIGIPVDPSAVLDGAELVVVCGVCGSTITDVAAPGEYPTDAPPVDA